MLQVLTRDYGPKVAKQYATNVFKQREDEILDGDLDVSVDLVHEHITNYMSWIGTPEGNEFWKDIYWRYHDEVEWQEAILDFKTLKAFSQGILLKAIPKTPQ